MLFVREYVVEGIGTCAGSCNPGKSCFITNLTSSSKIWLYYGRMLTDQPADCIIPSDCKTSVGLLENPKTSSTFLSLQGRIDKTNDVSVECAIDRKQNCKLSKCLHGAEQHRPDNNISNHQTCRSPSRQCTSWANEKTSSNSTTCVWTSTSWHSRVE